MALNAIHNLALAKGRSRGPGQGRVRSEIARLDLSYQRGPRGGALEIKNLDELFQKADSVLSQSLGKYRKWKIASVDFRISKWERPIFWSLSDLSVPIEFFGHPGRRFGVAVDGKSGGPAQGNGRRRPMFITALRNLTRAGPATIPRWARI